MGKYTTKYRRLYFQNNWKDKSNSGLIIGVMKWWAGPCDYCYKFAIFGFELSVWYERKFTNITFDE